MRNCDTRVAKAGALRHRICLSWLLLLLLLPLPLPRTRQLGRGAARPATKARRTALSKEDVLCKVL